MPASVAESEPAAESASTAPMVAAVAATLAEDSKALRCPGHWAARWTTCIAPFTQRDTLVCESRECERNPNSSGTEDFNDLADRKVTARGAGREPVWVRKTTDRSRNCVRRSGC